MSIKIDVVVKIGGSTIGSAPNRPARILPNGNLGVVYKGSARTVYQDEEKVFFINKGEQSFDKNKCGYWPEDEPLIASNVDEASNSSGRSGGSYSERQGSAKNTELSKYLEILGLDLTDNLTKTLLRKKYSELSMKYHPDLNDGSREFEDKFHEVQDAYEQSKKILNYK